MKELLDKLTQENQQISKLEAQLQVSILMLKSQRHCPNCTAGPLFDSFNLRIFQSQKEELDSALKAVTASGDVLGKANLEKENTKLKEELSSLPHLREELEILRARVTELSQLTGVMWQIDPTPCFHLLIEMIMKIGHRAS